MEYVSAWGGSGHIGTEWGLLLLPSLCWEQWTMPCYNCDRPHRNVRPTTTTTTAQQWTVPSEPRVAPRLCSLLYRTYVLFTLSSAQHIRHFVLRSCDCWIHPRVCEWTNNYAIYIGSCPYSVLTAYFKKRCGREGTWQESNNDEDVFLIPFRNYNIRRSRRLIVCRKYEYCITKLIILL